MNETPNPAGVPAPGDDPQKDESPSPALPVDNPDLPEDGDPDEVEEDPVPEEELGEAAEGSEQQEEPNDLSGIDKEFDDDEDDN